MTPHVSVLPTPLTTPAVLRSWWGGGVSAAVRTDDRIRLLVAAPSVQSDHATREAIAAVFTRQARHGGTLAEIVTAVADSVQRLGARSVCATFVEADVHGVQVVHRGNPAPLVVAPDGLVSAAPPHVPGPPLGSRTTDVSVERLPAGPDDLVVLSTPGFAAQLSTTLHGVTCDPQALWNALTDEALDDPYPGALALLVGARRAGAGDVRDQATPVPPVVSVRGA